jgi:hypothetical protein
LRRSPDVVRSVIAWSAALALLALLVMAILGRGPLTFRRPATVMSNSHPGLPSPDPYILFLKQAAGRIPRGETVVFLLSRQGNDSPIGGPYLIALGQMPDQIVLPRTALSPDSAPPDWVACFCAEFPNRRFQPAGSIAGGRLFRRVQ